MDKELEKIETLLKNIGGKIEKANEIARLNGENFNIFSILRLETKENQTHSRFIATLLDTEGDHGMGDTFLNLFYDELKNVVTENKSNILKDLRGALVDVKVEENIGKVNLVNATGGRLDITSRSKEAKGNIFIENKIYAGDQPRQIERYCNNPEKDKTIVLYLTLDGREPSTESKGDYESGKHFFLLSYSKNIINWLEKCQKEASDFPVIRETIKQYIILIKKLTGQLTSQKMETKVVELIKNKFEESLSIINNIEKAKVELIFELFSKMKDILSEKLNDDWEISYSDNIYERWSGGFYLKNKNWDGVDIAWVGNPYILTSENVLGIKVDKQNPIRNKIASVIKSEDFFSRYKEDTDGWLGFRRLSITTNLLIEVSSTEGLMNRATVMADEFKNLALFIDSCYKKTTSKIDNQR